MGGGKSFDSGNYDLLTSFFSPLIICLTVDTALIIDGQMGPGQEQGCSWNLRLWNGRAQSPRLLLCFPCSPGPSSRASCTLFECFSKAK